MEGTRTLVCFISFKRPFSLVWKDWLGPASLLYVQCLCCVSSLYTLSHKNKEYVFGDDYFWEIG